MKPQTAEKRNGSASWLLLALLLTGAFLLRSQQWNRFQVPDEDAIADMVWNLHHNPLPVGMTPLPGYPPFFMYLNFLLALVYQKLLIFLGFIRFDADFIHSGLGRLFTMKAGRLLTAFSGTLLVYVTHRIGKDFYNESVGFLAALLVAVNPFMILNSHIFKSDILLSLLLATMLFLFLKFLKTINIRFVFWGSFLLGLAVATKYNGAVQALVVPVTLWIAWKKMEPLLRRRAIVSVFVGGALGFMTGAPNWLFHHVKSVRAAYEYAVSQFSGFTFYEQPLPSYMLYLKDLLRSFGWVFLLFFLVGIVRAVKQKNRYDLLIIAYLGIYFLIQGKSNFYGNRMVLPLLAGMAVITARTLLDGGSRFGCRWAKLRKPFVVLVWGWAALFSGNLIADSLRTYHLLQTTTTLDEAFFYRVHHIPPEYRTGRETFTPKFPKDLGKWDLTDIRFQRFRGKNSLQFLSTGLLSKYILARTRNQRVRRRMSNRLRTFRPFHQIRKRPFSSWDDDITFWYQFPPELQSVPIKKIAANLPRLYIREEKDTTVFLPLQPYEKSPCFGVSRDGFFRKWLYSRDKIEKLILHFLSEKDPLNLTVTINGITRTCAGAAGRSDFTVEGIKPRRLFDDSVYSLEIISARKTPYCVAFEAIYRKSGTDREPGIGWPSSRVEKIPELFSAIRLPEWVIQFHSQTGIDLSLLAFMNRSFLFQNDPDRNAVDPITSGFFPLTRGNYFIKIKGAPILADSPVRSGFRMKLSIARKGGMEERIIVLPIPASNKIDDFSLEVSDPFVFVKIDCAEMRGSNFLVEEIILEPDYRAYLLSRR